MDAWNILIQNSKFSGPEYDAYDHLTNQAVNPLELYCGLTGQIIEEEILFGQIEEIEILNGVVECATIL